jgi:hypothetical protein
MDLHQKPLRECGWVVGTAIVNYKPRRVLSNTGVG